MWTQLLHTVAQTEAKLPIEQDKIKWMYNLGLFKQDALLPEPDVETTAPVCYSVT